MEGPSSFSQDRFDRDSGEIENEIALLRPLAGRPEKAGKETTTRAFRSESRLSAPETDERA